MGRNGDIDQDDELLVHAIAIVRDACRAVETEHGASYAAEYRRQLAEMILTDGDPFD